MQGTLFGLTEAQIADIGLTWGMFGFMLKLLVQWLMNIH